MLLQAVLLHAGKTSAWSCEPSCECTTRLKHKVHRDTGNAHVYSGTGTSQSVCHRLCMHPPPTWRAARCPRKLAREILHAGKTSAVSFESFESFECTPPGYVVRLCAGACAMRDGVGPGLAGSGCLGAEVLRCSFYGLWLLEKNAV